MDGNPEEHRTFKNGWKRLKRRKKKHPRTVTCGANSGARSYRRALFFVSLPSSYKLGKYAAHVTGLLPKCYYSPS